MAIGTDCDIALLTVEERDFWSGVESLNLGPLPRLQDFVTVVGYPIGGDSISVTSGVVSRIEVGLPKLDCVISQQVYLYSQKYIEGISEYFLKILRPSTACKQLKYIVVCHIFCHMLPKYGGV